MEQRNEDDPSMRIEITCIITQSHRMIAKNSQGGHFILWGDKLRLYVSIRKSSGKVCWILCETTGLRSIFKLCFIDEQLLKDWRNPTQRICLKNSALFKEKVTLTWTEVQLLEQWEIRGQVPNQPHQGSKPLTSKAAELSQPGALNLTGSGAFWLGIWKQGVWIKHYFLNFRTGSWKHLLLLTLVLGLK